MKCVEQSVTSRGVFPAYADHFRPALRDRPGAPWSRLVEQAIKPLITDRCQPSEIFSPSASLVLRETFGGQQSDRRPPRT